MVMETPGPQEVGREFVRQYYTMLHEAPDHLHRFYSNNSAFVHGGVEKAGFEQPPVIGQEAIDQKIKSLGFRDCHAKIRQVDSQATVKDSVVVQVTGELSNNGEPMRRFMQTFVLVPQTPKKFYVHNDIFRYQDEVFHDEDGDPEESDKFIIDPREDIMENGTMQEQASAGSSEAPPTYYDQVPLSNGSAHEMEPIKPVESSVVLVSTPAQAVKPEVDNSPSVESGRSEDPSLVEDEFEQKAEPKAPAVEPQQPEFSERPPEPKPVTWAALAGKNTPGGMNAIPNAYLPQSSGHMTKPPPVRSEQPKADSIASQPPQAQRAPRAPRDRFADRERNSISRGDTDGEGDSLNGGRRSNSVGGGGGGLFSKFSDNQQLFVGNLPLDISEADLRAFFGNYGKVEELRINTKSGGGKVPNFGFVVFESPETVQHILKIKPIKYNGEHRLNVEEKKPRINDYVRGGGSGRGGMSRGGGMGGQGMNSGRSGPPYGSSGGRGMKNGFGRQDMRGSPNLGPRGGMTQQGRR